MLRLMADFLPSVRPAEATELAMINDIVSAAVLSWPMAERLKRIALNVLSYDAVDLREFEVLVAEIGGQPAAVAAWDAATAVDAVGGARGALLHGLYVRPQAQRAGLGSLLQRRVAERAAALGYHGLVVKAERVSVGYFERSGYARLDQGNPFGIDYPYLFWHPLTAGDRPGARPVREAST
ncbi:MAG: GNAT family N-acetyltransferase [Pseudomonadales bacterium]